MMEVLRAEVTGMCFGVRDALRAIDRLDRPDEVTIHGQLVHNEVVLTQLGIRGFRMAGEDDREAIPETPNVLITAHGISDTERARLQSAGKTLIDTTCPLVKRVHEAAQKLQADGYFVLVVGRRHHVEVRGIVEDLAEYAIVERADDVRAYPFSRIGVVCQSTTTPAAFAAVVAALRVHNSNATLNVIDTICLPTREHQRTLDELLPKVDAMVVVGGRNSNNTRELVARAEAAAVPTYHVQDADDLIPDWFDGVNRVGLTAGTSTLDATLDAVEARIHSLANAEPLRKAS